MSFPHCFQLVCSLLSKRKNDFIENALVFSENWKLWGGGGGGGVLKFRERNFLPSLFLTLVPKILAVHSFSVLVFNWCSMDSYVVLCDLV